MHRTLSSAILTATENIMATLKDTFISSAIYNSLPSIGEVSVVLISHRQDSRDLCALIQEWGLPSTVSLRLVHKHFKTLDDEVMVSKVIGIPTVGKVQIMGPMNTRQVSQLHGLNYLVDEHGQLHTNTLLLRGPTFRNTECFFSNSYA